MKYHTAGHLYGVDLIRFVAAMLVLLHHFSQYSHSYAEVVSEPALRAFVFLHVFEGVGAVGVQIFFVISGFVIAMSSAGLSGRAGTLRFAIARATRILPALWISGAISVVALQQTGSDILPLLDRFVRSAILSPVGPYIDGVVWTLVVEAVFYGVVGISIFLCGRAPLVRIAIVLATLGSAYLLTLLVATIFEFEQLRNLLLRFPFKVFLLRHGVFFALGMLIWEALNRSLDRRLAGLIGFVFAMCLLEIWLEGVRSMHDARMSMLIWCAGVTALVLSTGQSSVPKFPGLFRYLGNMSYVIYLNHYTTGMVIVFLLSQSGRTGAPGFLLAVAVVAGISTLVLTLENVVRERARGISRRLLSSV